MQLDLFGVGRVDLRRRFFHYDYWEEYKFGMWRKIHGEEFEGYAQKAADLMANDQAFTEAMRRAITEWPNSCAMNLPAHINKLAWLGHAGCCIAIGSPEEATRHGWHKLNQQQQDVANEAARRVVAEWEIRYAQSCAR